MTITERKVKVAVVGAGAAGMMTAVYAAEYGADVCVFERNPYAGKKLKITGKGRCNVTNNCTPEEALAAVRTNPKFLYGALNRYTPSDVMKFFEDCKVPLKTERGRRVFPISDKAADIRDALCAKMEELGVTVKYNKRVAAVEDEGETVCLTVSAASGEKDSEKYCFDAVVIATGGVSYPLTGSTGDGHRMLADLGVKVTKLKPSLVPVITKENYFELAGLTLKNVRLSVRDKRGNTVYSEMGEMLFTHTGVSGPLVLSASANMQSDAPETYSLSVDLKPALTAEELNRRVLADFSKYAARDFINSLDDLLPKKLIPYVLKKSGIDGRKKVSSVTREERLALVAALKSFDIGVKSFGSIDEAIITSGGVDVKEINPKTMALKNHPRIFVAGEIIDVDAYTGGYNLQIAFSTARAAGEGAACI